MTNPTKVMTPAAQGHSYDDYREAGWSDADLVEHGLMEPRVDKPDHNVATDDRLRTLIERIERLEEEKKGIADDIRDVKAEAKAVGYDTKIITMIVKLRKMKPDERAEQETILDTYKAALGMG